MNNKSTTLAAGIAGLFIFTGMAISLYIWQKPSAAVHKDATTDRARDIWEWEMLRNPQTGEIPLNMRAMELRYARTLPTREETLLKKWAAGEDVLPLEWENLGPANIGGRTRAFAVDVADTNVLLAGGVSGGMWRSADGGASWQKASTPDMLHSVTCIAQDKRPGKTNIWYYGTGENRSGSTIGGGSAFYRGDGVMKSEDGGKTWKPLASTVSARPESFINSFQWMWRIRTNPAQTNADEVYAAVYGAIARSSDGGETWEAALGELRPAGAQYTDIDIADNGTMYAVLSEQTNSGDIPAAGIWRSTNGQQWQNITPSFWQRPIRRVVVAHAPSNPNIAYFLGETPGTGVNITRSGRTERLSLWRYVHNASGGTWEDLSAKIPDGTVANIGAFSSQTSYNIALAVHPENPDMVYFGGVLCYRSADGFATTQVIHTTRQIGSQRSTDTWFDHHDFFFMPGRSNTIFKVNDGGLWRSDNNTDSILSWRSLNNGYVTVQYYTLGVPQDSTSIAAVGGTQDNGTLLLRDEKERRWERINGGDGAACAFDSRKGLIYVSSQNAVIRRLQTQQDGSFDGTGNLSPTLPSGASYLFITPFILHPAQRNAMFLAGGNNVWRNRTINTYLPDDSTTGKWQQVTTITEQRSITTFGASEADSLVLYAGTSGGKIYKSINALDSVSEFTELETPFGSAYVSSIAVDPKDANHVLVALSNYGVRSIFVSQDGGVTWRDIAGNLEENPDGSGSGPSVRCVAIGRYGDSTVYFAGTSVGLFSVIPSSQQGSDIVWEYEGSTSIGNVIINAMEITAQGKITVATHGNGMYRASLPTPSSIAERSPIRAENLSFTLSKPYPLPARERVSVDIQRRANNGMFQGTIRVLTISGREVYSASVQSSEQRITLQVPLTEFAGGSYLFVLQTPEGRAAMPFVKQ